MKRRLATVLAVPCLLLLGATPPAQALEAPFGVESFASSFTGEGGEAVTQAGSHPFAMTTSVSLAANKFGGLEEALKDLIATEPSGFVGNPTAVPPCPNVDFVTKSIGCPDASALGTIALTIASGGGGGTDHAPVYNLPTPPGVAQKLGFWVLNSVPVTIELGVSPNAPYNIVGGPTNTSQVAEVRAAELTLWGVPAAETHDGERGRCEKSVGPSGEKCHANLAEIPFLTLPRSCTGGPLVTRYAADSWQFPGAKLPDGLPDLEDPNWKTGFTETTDAGGNPIGLSGCGKLGFSPEIAAMPTSKAAESSTGLDFAVDVNHNEGITNPEGNSDADIVKTVVTLPEGMTANPSSAGGLGVCTEAQLGAETPYLTAGEGPYYTPPGAGCPDASKLGTVEVETPVLEGKLLKGSLFLAKPYQNPEHTLLALYMVIREPQLGLIFKVPLKVEPDPQTGQLVTTAEGLPPYPFSHFRLHFREGARSPLVTPPTCGSHTVEALLYPSSGGAPVASDSAFEIISGPDGAPCPSGGLPPFKPGLEAGTYNPAAGHFSPFYVGLSRTDAEQEITHFSIKLPPGVTGKLAGIPFCSDAQIAAAKARERQPHGGEEELLDPSCPAASEVGRTLVGSGVGTVLAYVPGKAYLAGPYHGSNLSIVAITAAKVGPFDLGTVVVREALRINPETAEVFIDATGSDPIPHIVDGIPVHLRDIRVYADRPEFVLNPTSCEPTSTASTVLGSGLDFASEADDNPVTITSRFQAADCGSLGFGPRLQLKLKGKANRGGNPSLRAVLRPRVGDANASRISVALPHSEFLDQAHIGTVCTRVQFAAGAGNGAECPAASVYGHARAWTPLLGEPLEGPIFLRSSEHPLPDLVLAMHGLIDVDAVGRIDSVHGGIRNTFDFVPDAPISKVVVDFAGGRKGLLENSTNICRGKHTATIKMEAHNGRLHNFAAPLEPQCGKGGAKKHKRRHGR